jgi:hypothetical protein
MWCYSQVGRASLTAKELDVKHRDLEKRYKLMEETFKSATSANGAACNQLEEQLAQ